MAAFQLVGFVWVGGEFWDSEEAEESQIEHGIWGSMDGFIKPPVCIRLKGTDVGLRLLCCGMFHIHLFVATHYDIKTDQFSERLCWISMSM